MIFKFKVQKISYGLEIISVSHFSTDSRKSMQTESFAFNNKKLAASKAYSIPPARCRSKPCKLVKNSFSALNFFMHIFNMSLTYLPCIKRTH